MQDRITADRLFNEETNMTWKQLVNKTSTKLSQQGITSSSDIIYQEIIKSSQRSRSSVNKALGVK
jgi:methylphosphotriester-DNA--protein-cysteine methyltransferase